MRLLIVILVLDVGSLSIHLFSRPLENHREESAFDKHLTSKVLVVNTSSLFPPDRSSFRKRKNPTYSVLSLFAVHLFQLLCGAFPHSRLQAGCAFASKGNSEQSCPSEDLQGSLLTCHVPLKAGVSHYYPTPILMTKFKM